MRDNSSKPVLVSVVGPTAVGKTVTAIKIAEHFQTEIISADSRQFYKEMEIGTAKPSAEELARVQHHFINSHSIASLYSAGEYGRDAQILLEQLFDKHQLVLAVGGSSLYLKALWEGFDEMPEVAASIRENLNQELKTHGLERLLEELKATDPMYYDQVDRSNGQRVIRALEVIRSSGKPFSSFRKEATNTLPYENIKIGINMEREDLFERINQRMDAMIEAGLFDEAASLVGYKDHNALQTVGYSEVFGFFDHAYDKEEAIRLLKRNSRRYAKRQMTWLRRYDDIQWFHPNETEQVIEYIKDRLSGL